MLKLCSKRSFANLICITGNTSCGKSSVSKILRISFGIPVFDSDAAVRDIYKNDTHIICIAKKILPEIVVGNQINKKILTNSILNQTNNSVVFVENVREAVLIKLNTFTKSRQRLRFIAAEIPLLFELGWHKMCHKTIMVQTSDKIREKRFAAKGGNILNFTLFEKRQVPQHKKGALSDFRINNNLSQTNLYRQIYITLKKIQNH